MIYFPIFLISLAISPVNQLLQALLHCGFGKLEVPKMMVLLDSLVELLKAQAIVSSRVGMFEKLYEYGFYNLLSFPFDLPVLNIAQVHHLLHFRSDANNDDLVGFSLLFGHILEIDLEQLTFSHQ